MRAFSSVTSCRVTMRGSLPEGRRGKWCVNLGSKGTWCVDLELLNCSRETQFGNEQIAFFFGKPLKPASGSRKELAGRAEREEDGHHRCPWGRGARGAAGRMLAEPLAAGEDLRK